MHAVHNSPFRGQWYPETASELRALLDEKYASSQARIGTPLTGGLGFVVPHAGPAYSGTVAAAVYRVLREQGVERVVLLAFPHHGLLGGVAVPDVQAIATPLGELPIDHEFAPAFRRVQEGDVCDHSFEIQLPFLQTSVPGARVAPLYVGRLNSEDRRKAAAALAALWRPGTVFVASSDFTHYGRAFDHLPFPTDRSTGEHLRELDFEYMEAAGSLDADRFLEAVGRHDGTVCGTGPISLLLETLRCLEGDGVYPYTLDYQTSGELTDDWHHSVSYAALGFYPRSAFSLAEADRESLLESASETLRRLRYEGNHHGVTARGQSPVLHARRAAFVSLHRGEELLGCLGTVVGLAPLLEEIPRLALSAALDDPRFRPATEGVGPIDIEISVLTPMRRIYDVSEFVVGRHGGYLKLENRSGLLLPQVAVGHDWSAADFAAAVERKSNLWKGAWRDPRARLYVFEAEIFSRCNAVE